MIEEHLLTDKEMKTFEALFDPDFTDRLALMRAYVGGRPTTAICLVDPDPIEGGYTVTPLFVAVTGNMQLRGPDGEMMDNEKPN